MKKSSPILSETVLTLLGVAMLGAQSVYADYQSAVLSDGPLAYYPLNLDVDTGSTASDVSGNNNPGTLVNIYSGFNNAVGPSEFITNGVSFDGFTTYVDLSTGGNPTLLDFSGPISLEAWVQPANPSASLQDIIAKGYDSAVDSSELQLRLNGGHYEGGSYNNTVGGRGAGGGTASSDWAYLVCTFDGANWNMYVNGVRVGQGADTTGALNFSTPWAIGAGTADGASRKFVGNISQVAIYNYGLSSNQVLDHFAQGLVGVPAANAKPIITVQPQSQSTYVGGSVTFTVGVVSALATTNQWFKNGSPLAGKTNKTLVLNNVQPGDDVGYSVLVGNANGTTNSVIATLSLFVPAQLQWLGNGNSGQWDTGGSPNWLDLVNSGQAYFNPGDQVRFNDVAGAPTNVVVASSVEPSLITVDAATNYFFTGAGPITGTGGLVKKGPGTLTMLSGASMTGPVAIGGGKVYAGNFAFTAASSITITNNATLDFGGADISGNKPVFVSGTGVSNVGALINSSFETYGNVLSITLLGDTRFGGSSRWDLENGSSLTGPHNLTVAWSAADKYAEWKNLTINSDVGDIDLTLGKIGLKGPGNYGSGGAFVVHDGGELDFWENANSTRSIHVLSNGLLQVLSSSGSLAMTPNWVLEQGARWSCFWGDGSLTLNGTVTLNGVAHIVVGDKNLTIPNVISGPGGFVWDAYNHQIILQAANTYSGPTIIGEGLAVALEGSGSISHSSLIFFGGSNPNSIHVDATGRPDQTLALAGGQTLAGVGLVNGNLIVGTGATLSPSGTNTSIGITTGTNAFGTIGASGDITLSGTTIIKLDGSLINDMVQSTGGGITYGGTLHLSIGAVPLADGNSFQVFSGGSYNGSFDSITPATPGAGLAWDKSQLSSGILSVIAAASQPVLGSIITSGSNLILSGSNGVANASYVVLTSTNIATPIGNWIPLVTNAFDSSGAFSVTNALNGTSPQNFYLIEQP